MAGPGDRLKNNIKKSAENKVNSVVKDNENLTTKKGLNSRSENFFKEPLDIEGFLDGSAEASYEVDVKGGSLYEGTHENILHKFATYTTLFTLSGISEEELPVSYTHLTLPTICSV